jgi:hypothetical protein
VEFISGRWRVETAWLTRGEGWPRQYLRIYFHGHHVADVRTIGEVAKIMAANGHSLSELVRQHDSRLR